MHPALPAWRKPILNQPRDIPCKLISSAATALATESWLSFEELWRALGSSVCWRPMDSVPHAFTRFSKLVYTRSSRAMPGAQDLDSCGLWNLTTIILKTHGGLRTRVRALKTFLVFAVQVRTESPFHSEKRKYSKTAPLKCSATVLVPRGLINLPIRRYIQPIYLFASRAAPLLQITVPGLSSASGHSLEHP